MGEIHRINPYTFEEIKPGEAVPPRREEEFIRKAPQIMEDITAEEAKRLRLENVSILNAIIEDDSVSPTCRVQAIQARDRILKDLVDIPKVKSVTPGIDIKALLSDDEDHVAEKEEVESNETDSSGRVSVEDIKKQMLDDEEE